MFHKTLEDIQSTFSKALTDLQKLREYNDKQTDLNGAEIERRMALNRALEDESAKAARFQTNLENLLG